MRLCDLRRRRRPPARSAAGGGDLQRRVLHFALAAHPVPLGFDGAAALLDEAGDLDEAMALASAVRDLVLAGLLASDGLRLCPTPAALAFARLEAGR